MTAALPTRFCSGCLADLPVDQFRRRRAGGEARESDCHACHAEKMRDYRKARRAGNLIAFSARIRRESASRRVQAAAAVIIQRLGGPQAFAGAMLEQFAASAAGSRQRFNVLRAVLDLVVACEQPATDADRAV